MWHKGYATLDESHKLSLPNFSLQQNILADAMYTITLILSLLILLL